MYVFKLFKINKKNLYIFDTRGGGGRAIHTYFRSNSTVFRSNSTVQFSLFRSNTVIIHFEER